MIKLIESEKLENAQELNEITKLTAKDSLIILSEDGKINIGPGFLPILSSIKAKMEIKPCSNEYDLCYIYGQLSLSGQDINFGSLKNHKELSETIRRYGKSSASKPTSTTRTPRVKKSVAETTDVKSKNEVEEKVVESPQKIEPFKKFLLSCDSEDIKISDYSEQILKACKKSIIQKITLVDCLKETLPSEEVTKKVCKILGPKAKELTKAINEDIASKKKGKE